MDNVITFNWRNNIATYNPHAKVLTFDEDINLVPWENYPGDAVVFAQWISDCISHMSGGPLPNSKEFY